MTVDEIITEVKNICKKNNVKHLYLFGSFAKGTAHDKSDIDFVVKGIENYDSVLNEINDSILTLRKIDLFDYENIKNPILKEAINKYAKIIY